MKTIPRYAIFLAAFCLAVPNSFALRQTGLEESPRERTRLAKALGALSSNSSINPQRNFPASPRLSLAGMEEKALVRILIADTPQRETVPGDIRKLIQSMKLERKVELIEERGQIGDQQELKELIERYEPTIILIFTGRKILVNPYVVHAASQHGVRLVIRAGAGYENISVEAMTHYGVPFLRSHGLGDSMTDFTLRFVFAGLRLGAGRQPSQAEVDISEDPELSSLFQMSPAVFHEALDEAIKRKRGEMIPGQKELVFGPLSKGEFLDLTKSLAGKRIGILGFGVIGEKVVRRLNEIKKLAQVSFEIMAAAPSLTDPVSDRAKVARDLGVRIVPENELFQASDILTVHIPSTDANRRYITPQSFMGRTKPLILINTAREDLIDRALFKEKQPFELTFLGDVDFDSDVETLRATHPETFIITPHIGGLTAASAQGAIEALLKTLEQTLPVLLGEGDSASIQTINGIPIAPIIRKPDLDGKNSSGLEERLEKSGEFKSLLLQREPALSERRTGYIFRPWEAGMAIPFAQFTGLEEDSAVFYVLVSSPEQAGLLIENQVYPSRIVALAGLEEADAFYDLGIPRENVLTGYSVEQAVDLVEGWLYWLYDLKPAFLPRLANTARVLLVQVGEWLNTQGWVANRPVSYQDAESILQVNDRA